MVAASLVSANATPPASTVAGNIKLRIKNNLLMVFIASSFDRRGSQPGTTRPRSEQCLFGQSRWGWGDGDDCISQPQKRQYAALQPNSLSQINPAGHTAPLQIILRGFQWGNSLIRWA